MMVPMKQNPAVKSIEQAHTDLTEIEPPHACHDNKPKEREQEHVRGVAALSPIGNRECIGLGVGHLPDEPADEHHLLSLELRHYPHDVSHCRHQPANLEADDPMNENDHDGHP